MKLKRIMSALLAAAVMARTVVYAEDILSSDISNIELVVKNDKGTYSFTDEELAAYIDYNAEVNDFGEDTTYDNSEAKIIGEDSVFDFPEGNTYESYFIVQIIVELIDIEKNADGSTTFTQLDYDAYNRHSKGDSPIWYAFSTNYMGGYRAYGTETYMDENGKYVITYPTAFPVTGLIESINYDYFESKTFDYDDVDMVVFHFMKNQVDGKRVYPWAEDGSLIEGNDPRVEAHWALTEQGAAMLKKANGTTDTDTDEAPTTSGYTNDLIAVIPENTTVTMKTAAAEGVFSQRFVQKVSVEELEGASKVEFTLSNGTDTVKCSTDKCYSSLYVNGSIQQAGEGFVFLCFTVKDIPEDTQLTVEAIEIV